MTDLADPTDSPALVLAGLRGALRRQADREVQVALQIAVREMRGDTPQQIRNAMNLTDTEWRDARRRLRAGGKELRGAPVNG